MNQINKAYSLLKKEKKLFILKIKFRNIEDKVYFKVNLFARNKMKFRIPLSSHYIPYLSISFMETETAKFTL